MFRVPSIAVAFLVAAVFTRLAGSVPLRAEDGAVKVLAAGSLRAAVNEIAIAFSRRTGVHVESSFGPSGVLRRRIEQGEAADLFASADMANPLALSQAGNAADYGQTLLPTKNDSAASLALFILSQDEQQILAKNGFDAPLLTQGL